jgi:lipoprotein Spr
MVKHILFPATIVLLFCAFTPAMGQKSKQVTATNAKTELKFLDDININVGPLQDVSLNSKPNQAEPVANKKSVEAPVNGLNVEQANTIQFKYALLLNVEVEQVQNINLFRVIDEWLGTRYKLGGSTRSGIDCSAFMQVLFSSLYNITLPRTAREQYSFSRKISRSELKEGDLIFFNTTHGVSHVGMYLQNNKFVHASSSGVTISDLNEEYWDDRFIGVRRVDNIQQQQTSVANL